MDAAREVRRLHLTVLVIVAVTAVVLLEVFVWAPARERANAHDACVAEAYDSGFVPSDVCDPVPERFFH